MSYNSRAWIIWVTAVAILTMVARNPLYSLLLLIVSLGAVHNYARQYTPMRSLFLRISLVVLLFSSIYHALFIHVGDHVLIELPNWPLVGGVITIEAAVDGFRNGLVLIAIMAAFIALNSIVPTRELIRLAPASFQDLGVVILIAITYIPETRRHLRRIQEAQAIRGHRPQGYRDWRPLLIPLLVGGLERAMRLSEAMVARGHIAAPVRERRASERIALIIGLFISLAGWLTAIWLGWPGYIMLGFGILLVAWLILRSGRRIRRTHYKTTSWTTLDTLMVVSSITALLLVIVPWPVLVPWPFMEPLSLSYSPYPRLHLPEFEPIVGLALALLALPLLLGSYFLDKQDREIKSNPDSSSLGKKEMQQAQ